MRCLIVETRHVIKYRIRHSNFRGAWGGSFRPTHPPRLPTHPQTRASPGAQQPAQAERSRLPLEAGAGSSVHCYPRLDKCSCRWCQCRRRLPLHQWPDTGTPLSQLRKPPSLSCSTGRGRNARALSGRRQDSCHNTAARTRRSFSLCRSSSTCAGGK